LASIKIDGKLCPPEGTAKSAKEKDLNRHKNRYVKPKASDIDKKVTLAKMLAPGDDTNRFTEDKAATIEGYVINASPGGCSKYATSQGETCNCNTIDKNICDTHIVVGATPNANEKNTIIVEVTERLRLEMKGQNWSTDNLHATLKGKKVKFTGWLTFDTAHVGEAENTNPGGAKNWRATVWEIHPVTAIHVISN
jgi:hypothetical protein